MALISIVSMAEMDQLAVFDARLQSARSWHGLPEFALKVKIFMRGEG